MDKNIVYTKTSIMKAKKKNWEWLMQITLTFVA